VDSQTNTALAVGQHGAKQAPAYAQTNAVICNCRLPSAHLDQELGSRCHIVECVVLGQQLAVLLEAQEAAAAGLEKPHQASACGKHASRPSDAMEAGACSAMLHHQRSQPTSRRKATHLPPIAAQLPAAPHVRNGIHKASVQQAEARACVHGSAKQGSGLRSIGLSRAAQPTAALPTLNKWLQLASGITVHTPLQPPAPEKAGSELTPYAP
jgi:hypothetical protein